MGALGKSTPLIVIAYCTNCNELYFIKLISSEPKPNILMEPGEQRIIRVNI